MNPPLTGDVRQKSPFLFPAIQPYDCFDLAVDEPHILKVEQCGRQDGIPAIFLHGGPGGACQPDHRRLFDPELFRVVLFDQRGCGLSRPKRCLSDNTTPHLIADLERIRNHLNIQAWLMVGGSWGSTLALAYAQTHPERVLGIALRAVFLGTAQECRWAFETAAQTQAPELWKAFRALLPPDERADPVSAYMKRLASDDPVVHAGAAWVWHDYERSLSQIAPKNYALPSSLEAAAQRRDPPNSPYLESWYIGHDFFLEPNSLITDAHTLQDIPGTIVQSRYDLLCPPVNAYRLHGAWPGSRLHILPKAGHALSEPEVIPTLTQAISNLGQQVA